MFKYWQLIGYDFVINTKPDFSRRSLRLCGRKSNLFNHRGTEDTELRGMF